MAIFNWIKFLWALWKLYPEAKKLWDDVHAQYAEMKDKPKPTIDDFKSLVKTGFAKSMTDISQIQLGLKSDGTMSK